MSIEIKGEKRGRLPRKPAEIWTGKDWARFLAIALAVTWLGDRVAQYILNWGR